MLSGFYIIPSYRGILLSAFQQLVEGFSIVAALVASNDSNYVSLAFEKMKEFNTTFDIQAYNFTYGEPRRLAEYDITCMEKVTEKDYEQMNIITEKQWDGLFEDSNFEF